MADVFISYASEDRDRAGPLAVALESQGWSVWWDRHIVAGQTFDEVIERELRSARSVVTLWSASSTASEWVRNESTLAAERGVLVPALIDRVELPLEFRRKQTVDLVGWDGDTSREGFQALCRGIAASVSGAAPSPRQVTPGHLAAIDSEVVRVRWTGASVPIPDRGTESRNELRLPVSFQLRGPAAVLRGVRVVTESGGAMTTWDGTYEADDEPVAEHAPADGEIRRHRKPLRPFELSDRSSFVAKVIDFVADNPDPLGTGTYAIQLQVQSGSGGWSTVQKASFTVPADFTLTGRSPSGAEFHRYDRWQVFPLRIESR